MKNRCLFAFAIFLFLFNACHQEKHVLLIGDSISMGYTPFVQEILADEAIVKRIPMNGGDTWRGLLHIDEWLADTVQWDVIHFNWGLWDLAYRRQGATAYGDRDKINGEISTTHEEYQENLEKLVSRLKETGAKLIWCTTTFVPEGEAGRFVGDGVRFNYLARPIMEKHDVIINDLHPLSTYIHPEHGRKAGDVHYTKEGSKILAKQVAETITKQL